MLQQLKSSQPSIVNLQREEREVEGKLGREIEWVEGRETAIWLPMADRREKRRDGEYERRR